MIRELLTISLFITIASSTISQEKQDFIREKVLLKREFIFEFLKNNQLDSLQESSLMSFGNYSTLNIVEHEFLLLLSDQFDEVLAKINENERYERKSRNYRLFKYGIDSLQNTHKYSRLVYDSLTVNLLPYLVVNKETIQNRISSSTLSEEEKSFLQLYMLFYILNFDFCDQKVEKEMLSKSKEFILEYPDSKYSGFIKKYTNLEFEESPFGVGVLFGSGQIIPKGNLANYFKNDFPVKGTLATNYNRLNLLAAFSASVGTEIRRELVYQKPWLQGDRFLYLNAEILLGYYLIDRKKIGISPFVGISSIGLSPYRQDEDDNYYNDVSNIMSNNPLKYGVNIDFRWGRTDCSSPSMYGRTTGKDYVYGITRLGIGYNNPKFNKTLTNLDGSLWFFEIGIGMHNQLSRKVKNRL